jgi:hypothetical protein
MRDGEGTKYVPYRVFPERPGLLFWGSDDGGRELYWFAKGKPTGWRIVVRSEDNEFEEFDGPMTSFLARVFAGRLRPKAWPMPFFSEVTEIRFQAISSSSAPQETVATLYELYVDNGNKAGFWARQWGDQPGVARFIRTVNGKTEGPLSGIPNEYDRPPVICDLYWDGKLFQESLLLWNAYQAVFVRIPTPEIKE